MKALTIILVIGVLVLLDLVWSRLTGRRHIAPPHDAVMQPELWELYHQADMEKQLDSGRITKEEYDARK